MSDLSRIDRLAIEEFARVMNLIPKQAAPRGPVQDESDFCDDPRQTRYAPDREREAERKVGTRLVSAPWTDERCARLRKLWAEGFSCSKIASDLGCGISRNAVIGKVHRLGLQLRRERKPDHIRRPRKPKAIAPPRVRKRPKWNAQSHHFDAHQPEPYIENPVADQSIPQSQRKSLMDLTADSCRWPVGDPSSPEFFFCGATVAPGFSYCRAHCARAYTTASSLRPASAYRFGRRAA